MVVVRGNCQTSGEALWFQVGRRLPVLPGRGIEVEMFKLFHGGHRLRRDSADSPVAG